MLANVDFIFLFELELWLWSRLGDLLLLTVLFLAAIILLFANF